ncbi:DUF5617 domain-containing protein [Legionella sp. km772]|uniref:DUF5617 domain-containing protein n=1 Tax=Legionella sp. km772 TaxID=2498111 RepID=UPI000F8EE639|nr:DUF5617 domain-containing protein [Legionella sp. km772]RUR11002.1 hypothetical protein ELY15_07550 [Legionella sp. km772]
MTTRTSQLSTSFFSKATSTSLFPDSYQAIWKTPKAYSNILKIKALLTDYTKENFFLGSFFGRLFSCHLGRHHVAKVHEIIHTPYECVEDLIYDLKLLKPQKGGSLDRRLRFIEVQMDEVERARASALFSI